MSADEIRRLAADALSNGIKIRDELLKHAAMVERCEEVRTNLELNRKDYANRGVCGSLVEINNDEIAMLDYIEKGKQK